MQHITTTAAESHTFGRGDLVWDELDSRLHRYHSAEDDGYIVLMDRDMMRPLPDLRHPSQVMHAADRARSLLAC